MRARGIGLDTTVIIAQEGCVVGVCCEALRAQDCSCHAFLLVVKTSRSRKRKISLVFFPIAGKKHYPFAFCAFFCVVETSLVLRSKDVKNEFFWAVTSPSEDYCKVEMDSNFYA